MIRYIFISLLLLTSNIIYAQDIMIGARGGLTFSQLKMGYLLVPGANKTIFQQNSLYGKGVFLGGFARFKFKNFYIQPEGYFSVKGASFDKTVTDSISKNSTTQEIKISTVGADAVLMIGYQISIFRINAGPVISYNINDLLNYKEAMNGLAKEGDAEVKSLILAYQAGVGVDIGDITLDFRYESQLTPITSTIIANSRLTQRMDTFQLSVGYIFGKPKKKTPNKIAR
jgi:hypothetical protein